MKIDKPALIVVVGDASNPWMKLYEDLQKRIPNARFEKFEGCGHALFVDDAPRFNSLLDALLSQIHKQAKPH